MAKLPDETAFGPLAPPESKRPISGIDTSAFGAGERALGQGISKFGASLDAYARKAQAEKNQLETAQAEADYLITKGKIRQELSAETNPDGLRQKYEPRFNEALTNATQIISDPRARQIFELRRNADVHGNVLATDEYAGKLRRDQTLAKATDQLETLRQQALTAQDDFERGSHVDAGRAIIQGLHTSGHVSAEWAQKTQRDWVQKYAEGAISLMPPEQQVKVLGGGNTAAGGPSQVKALTEAATRLGVNPADLAAAISYETGGTFDPNKWGGKGGRYLGLIQFGPSEQRQYGVRPGMSFEQQMEAVEAFLRDRGVKPGMGISEIYRTINGGNPRANLNASDGNGTIAQHISRIQAGHYGSADRFLGGRGEVEGGGGLAGFIPPDRREDMRRRADASVLQQAQATQSAAALENFQVKQAIADDVTSTLKTGVGLELSPERVRATFGDNGVEEWQQARTDAHAIWTGTHNLASMTNAQISERVASLEPKAGDADFVRKGKVRDAVKAEADRIVQLRDTDPAASVANDPEVRKANAAIDPKQPETLKAAVAARLAAQEAVGIPEARRSPLTQAEAEDLGRPIETMLPGQERAALRQILETAKQRYGEHADAAFAAAVHRFRLNQDAGKVAARILKSLANGEQPERDDLRKLDDKQDVAAANRAMWGELPGIDVDPAGDINFMGKPTPPDPGLNLPANAVRALRDNPALAPQFDEKYGKGAADKILKRYPVR